MPVASATTTTAVAARAGKVGQTSQGAVTATACRANSRRARNKPGVATMICRLSPGVENIAGSPTRTTREGAISQGDCCATAQGPATQAINSTRKRSPELNGVSKGCWSATFLALVFIRVRPTLQEEGHEEEQCDVGDSVGKCDSEYGPGSQHQEWLLDTVLAGAEGFEPPAYGFGDRCSSN